MEIVKTSYVPDPYATTIDKLAIYAIGFAPPFQWDLLRFLILLGGYVGGSLGWAHGHVTLVPPKFY